MDNSVSAKKRKSLATIDIVYIAMSVALITVCSWIQIPGTIPFTMQTFAVFLTVCLLGGARAVISIIIYIALAAAGVPVLAMFKGGIGALMGPTGGYVIGFLFIALIMWLTETLLGKALWVRILSMLIGLAVCYGFGTLWFMHVYVGKDGSHMGLAAVLSLCVLPYIIPDLIKMALAISIGSNKSLNRIINTGGR